MESFFIPVLFRFQLGLWYLHRPLIGGDISGMYGEVAGFAVGEEEFQGVDDGAEGELVPGDLVFFI